MHSFIEQGRTIYVGCAKREDRNREEACSYGNHLTVVLVLYGQGSHLNIGAIQRNHAN
jgi:hypothetical protein